MSEEVGYLTEAISWFDLAWQLLLIILGLLFSALFSGAEVAFFSLTTKTEMLAKEATDPHFQTDQRVMKMLEKPRRLLATILIGNTFANIITSVVAALMTGKLVASLGVSEVVVFTVEVLILTFVIIILSEITPKVIAINDALKVSRRVSTIIYFFFLMLTPLSKLIADSTMLMERYLPKPSSKISSHDIKTMAEVGEMEGSIRGEEREIIENVIEFSNTSVREIMTSRVNVVAINCEDSLDAVLEVIREKGFSRMPLFSNDLDNIEGVIYSKDVLPYLNNSVEVSPVNWKTIARKALFIPATKKLDDLLRDFQQEKTHIAIVVDEYGGTEGLITLDDILEEIVGDISDESDVDEQLYTKLKNGSYVFDAKIDLDDMEEVIGIELTTSEDEYETLGGLIYHITERIPNVGERVDFKGLQMAIHSVQNNRVRKLRVTIPTDLRAQANMENGA